MDPTLIEQIHQSPFRLAMAVTGGGSLTIGDLLCVPGASRTVLEATVPYAAAALTDYLQAAPEQFCSARTTRAMAMRAFWRAQELAAGEAGDAAVDVDRLLGVACNASLASDRPKRGDHRAHLAIQSANSTSTVSIVLDKGLRTRVAEERLIATLLLERIAESCGIAGAKRTTLADAGTWSETTTVADPVWRQVLLGQREAARVCGEDRPVRVLFPGAFNPLHAGHRHMADVVSERLGEPVDFEIAMINVDKPPLDYTEIDERLRQFAPHDRVWITRAPTFVEKSRLFPAVNFVVGVDTILRIADPKYYGDSQARDAAIGTIRQQGCRFLVFGRALAGAFRSLSQTDPPDVLREICQEIPEPVFREDISSTELRMARDREQ